MQDLPTAAELVEAVREFLESEIFPAVEGRKRFHTRVAMNVLAIVQRELEEAPAADARERARLAGLMPGVTGSLGELNAELATRIREGSLDTGREDLVEHLRATVRDKLAIANPRYIAD
jgi:hypothetical protein